jgi:hypothetical protein
MDDLSGAKEYENIMHKVGIRLGRRPIFEEQNNVDEKPVDEPPKVDAVAPEVVVVAPKFNL